MGWICVTVSVKLYVKKLPQNYQEMSYIKYGVNFLPLFYAQNIKISVYVKSLHNFNFFSESVTHQSFVCEGNPDY